MKEQSKQHVQVPNDMTGISLSPVDLLVYVNIRRHLNTDTKLCFPSILTICEKAKLSKPTVIKSIKFLKEEGYIDYETKGRTRYYTFSTHKGFEPFGYEFIDNPDLSVTEKAFWIATQQYSFKDEKGIAKVSYSSRELAKIINVSHQTVLNCEKSFKEKGLMTQIEVKSQESGLAKNEKIFHLDEFGQAVVHCLQDHENRISNNEKTLELALREIEKLKAQLAERDEPKEVTL